MEATGTATNASSRPSTSRGQKPALAAWLLLASVILSLVGVNLQMNQINWGIPYPYYAYVWTTVQFGLTPVANILSLMLGDRRKLWVKLNYVVIVTGLLLRFAYWFVDSVLKLG